MLANFVAYLRILSLPNIQLILIFQLVFSLLNTIPLVQFSARVSHIIVFDVIFFSLFCIIMGYFRVFEYQGTKELGILLLLLSWGIYGIKSMIDTLRTNHIFHKNPKKLHLEIYVNHVCSILIIPYTIKSAKLGYLQQLNEAFPGVRIA